MSEPVRISYRWDAQNVKRLFDASYRYQFEHSAKRYIGWFFIALAQFGVVAAMKQGGFGLLIFSTIVLFYWYYGKKAIAKHRAKASFETSPFKDKTITMEVDDDDFTIDAHDEQVHWSWEDIDEVIPLGEDIMLYKYPYFHYIPANGFASLEEKSRFKSMARAHGKLK